MSAENLVIPPVGNIYARIKRVEATRGNIEYFQRAATANVLEKMNNTLRDCAIEISEAKYIYALQGHRSVKTMQFIHTGRGSGSDEWSARQVDIKKRYDAWHKILKGNIRTIGICKRFCQDEESIDSIRKVYRISERRALWGLIWGLNEYSIISGWGNQIDPEK